MVEFADSQTEESPENPFEKVDDLTDFDDDFEIQSNDKERRRSEKRARRVIWKKLKDTPELLEKIGIQS